MRIALLSDVHGNLPAFRAVLADVEAAGVDAIWCLGDLVGYGAHPDDCVELARERCDVCLAGNHDLVVTGEHRHRRLLARRRGRGALDPGHDRARVARVPARAGPQRRRAPSRPLPRQPARPDLGVRALDLAGRGVHGADGRRASAAIGHSHVALFFQREGDGAAAGATAPAGTELDLSEGEWLLNPGGVGQPRDGDPRAAWLLLDTENWIASWRRVEYPIDEAAAAIEAAGLPGVLGQRLYAGQ